ncbi:transcriptional regulator NosR [Balneatrix alpica]|uniref:Transcriptional regulator NosR n=1 Tax=Balneatrix alpica TaxID=75684 RepID=A0ABV5ZEV3_9GAMM|nr:NosR/NirI family protein [Balneatrix alpica]
MQGSKGQAGPDQMARRLLAVLWLWSLLALALPAQALGPVKPVVDAGFLQQWGQQHWPAADGFSQVEAPWPVYQLTQGEQPLAYLFATDAIQRIPAYSGKPVEMLVALSPSGEILATEVYQHHEPILLVGIPEQALFDFVSKYVGLQVTDKVRVGSGEQQGRVSIDAITGATVTVMVVNEALMRTSAKVARALGLVADQQQASGPRAEVRWDAQGQADWLSLTGDGSIRRMRLSRGEVEAAFANTAAAGQDADPAKANEDLIDLFYAPLNLPVVGENLLGSSEYSWLMAQLQPGDVAIAVMANGEYSFKGNGYVRGGIFDRIRVRQGAASISFHDSDYFRLLDVYLAGMPRFSEMAIFVLRAGQEFDLAQSWQLELTVRRQVGPVESLFADFISEYQLPEAYLQRPAPVAAPVATEEEVWQEQPLWVSIWYEQRFQIAVLLLGLGLLTLVLFLQDVLVKRPRLIEGLRLGFLLYTLFFIGWYALGQLSVVNVFTFIHAFMTGFSWDTFLLDPVLFILWSFVALSLLLWGRGIFCGWLCPFGALQELVNMAARKLGMRQYELPYGVHERLWALKYIILMLLFALSLESLATAERYAEVEPFKTAITLRFQREWGFVLYALVLVLISLFTRKVYCRYLCPLGAALAIPARVRLFDWLKRRSECGQPCQRCARECEIQAIAPDGRINANECHHCLDCQVTYSSDQLCPPLIRLRKKRERHGLSGHGLDEHESIPLQNL